ncbi:hypothetical protein TNCV_4959811 [Trichonephila clavipes]|uniref:Uncharacterized protein n=1 Tax=Trichonephila clavipes TaxID=2585209 RepID=A0A8X6SSH5_TRICX|nr:hypothetical protein TNCV_4959811 [Trichonephila clavipes]
MCSFFSPPPVPTFFLMVPDEYCGEIRKRKTTFLSEQFLLALLMIIHVLSRFLISSMAAEALWLWSEIRGQSVTGSSPDATEDLS